MCNDIICNILLKINLVLLPLAKNNSVLFVHSLYKCIMNIWISTRYSSIKLHSLLILFIKRYVNSCLKPHTIYCFNYAFTARQTLLAKLQIWYTTKMFNSQ